MLHRVRRHRGVRPSRDPGDVHLSPDALAPSDVTNEEAFAWFFRAEYPQVVRTVSLLLRNSAAADDVAQEAFVRLHRHWAKVSRYERPEAWVRRVAINVAATHQRREARRRDVEHQAQDVLSPDSPLTGVGAELREALLRLPMRQRAIVVLFYFEDRPLAEIAGLLELTPGSAKVALHRARRRLALELGGVEVTDDV